MSLMLQSNEPSVVCNPQQNEVVESKNLQLLDITRALMIHMHIPKCFWSDALVTACYLINRMPSSVLDGTSPHSILFPHSPFFSLPPTVFWLFVMLTEPGFDKLNPRTTKCVLLGTFLDSKRLLVLQSYTSTITDVTFLEAQPYFPDTSSYGDSLLDIPLPTLDPLSPGPSATMPLQRSAPYMCTLDHPPACSHQLPWSLQI